jgi:hypothetical protein
MPKRAQRRWTIMLVPHGSGPTRAVELSRAVVTSLTAIAVVAVVAMMALAVAAIERGVNSTHSRLLAREHGVLVDEVQRVSEELAVLSDSLDSLSRRGQGLRLLGGLSLLDPGVLQGGIGGPVGAWPERDSLLALGPDGARALAARIDVDALTRRVSILSTSMSQTSDSLLTHQMRWFATPSMLPTRGRISSPFAPERVDPIVHVARPHEGMDVAAPAGSEIEAAAAGVVTEVGWVSGYGNLVAIDHGYGFVTRYAHCSRILVVRGQHVTRGQPIELVGSTGESTGPHVHYEVRLNGRPVDPKNFVLPDGPIRD